MRDEKLAKAKRLQAISLEFGVTQTEAEDVLRDSGEWFDRPRMSDDGQGASEAKRRDRRARSKIVNSRGETAEERDARIDEQLREEAEKSGKEFRNYGLGCLFLFVLLLLLIFGKEFLREDPGFPRGDEYYCTDRASLNCYLD